MSDLVDRLSRKIGIDVKAVGKSVFKTVSHWCRDVLDLLLTILVCGAFAWIVSVVLLYASQGLWSIYLETQVGKQYLFQFPWRARMISRIIHYPAATFSFSVCVAAVKGCLLVAAVSQVLYLARGFYENRSVMIKTLLWVPVCVAAGAWIFQRDNYLPFEAGLVLTVVPVLFMFHPCFELTAKCLPQANLVGLFRQTRRILKKAWRVTIHYIERLNLKLGH